MIKIDKTNKLPISRKIIAMPLTALMILSVFAGMAMAIEFNEDYQSPNYSNRPKDTKIQMIVIHHTGSDSVASTLDWFVNPTSKVSAHYVIAKDGTIYRLVKDDYKAWHAGKSEWKGKKNCNDFSIGIELVNKGDGETPFTDAQYKSLNNLIDFLTKEHPQIGGNVVGHKDIAPGRKTDPAKNFDWQKLDIFKETDKDLGGIDFSSIQLNYISVPSDQNEKTFSYVLKAKKAEEGDKIIDIEDATELSLSAFFIGLTLPDSKFWVNLDPLEPDVITDEDLRNTDVGRIMLEADLQMKKDLCKYGNPCESEIGEEFWALLDKKSEEFAEECMRKHPNEIEDADNVLFGVVSRNWIVPDKTDVYVTDGEVYIVDIALNVKSEPLYEHSTYQIVNQNLSLSDECKADLSEASKEYGRYVIELREEMILPLVVQEVNHGGYYSDLRRVYTSLALAQWYKDKYWHSSGIFTDFIDTNDLTGLESKYMWDAEDIWRDYVKSYEEGEYHCMKESYDYTGGGVIFTDINLTDIGDMPSNLKELTSEAVDTTFANEGDYYYLGESARLYVLGEAANWLHFGYDSSYTAYNPLESTINITNVAQLKRKWGIGCDDGSFSDISRSPAIYNGTLYTSGAGSRLTAYDAQTGLMLWQFGKGNAGWAPQPVVSEDGVVFYMEGSSGICQLYAVEANSGNMLWQAPIGFELGFSGAAEAVVTVDEANDLVYIVEDQFIGEDGKLFALDKQTGEIDWYKSKATDNFSFKGNYVLLSEGKLFAAAEHPFPDEYDLYRNDHILCINASSQDIEIIFDKPEGIELDDISKYTLCNDKLIVTFCDRADSAESIGTLVVYNVTSQAVVWQKEYSTAITGRIACNTTKNVIYVPTDPYLYALDATTGEEVWKYMGYGAIYNPSIANGIVYFISDTNMYAIDENTGEKLFFYPLGSKGCGTTQVAICDGMLYFSGHGGTCDLYALGLPAMRFAKVILFLTTP